MNFITPKLDYFTFTFVKLCALVLDLLITIIFNEYLDAMVFNLNRFLLNVYVRFLCMLSAAP